MDRTSPASGEDSRSDANASSAPYAHQLILGENLTPANRPHARLTEEIRRRQLSLVARYVMALRAR